MPTGRRQTKEDLEAIVNEPLEGLVDGLAGYLKQRQNGEAYCKGTDHKNSDGEPVP